MSERDYYETLGVPKGASQSEIKSAFRNLARQYHPDVSEAADAEERFKEINEAYAVLSDEEKRAAYDRYGHAGSISKISSICSDLGWASTLADAAGAAPTARAAAQICSTT